MSVRVSSVLVFLCLGRGLATWLFTYPSSRPNVYKIHSARLFLMENRPEGPIRKAAAEENYFRLHIVLFSRVILDWKHL
jgi:hypothetical protein